MIAIEQGRGVLPKSGLRVAGGGVSELSLEYATKGDIDSTVAFKIAKHSADVAKRRWSLLSPGKSLSFFGILLSVQPLLFRNVPGGGTLLPLFSLIFEIRI